MASVKNNIILNGINTLTGILFPVITFPYAARVLLPDGIGAINFLNSIIGYIVLLTSLGIPMYAVREVAKYRDDKASRDKITIEIFLLSANLCLLGYFIVWVLAEYVPQIHRQASLFYILSLTILFTTIGVNWFYQGIEDFKFITIRAIVIRTMAAAALFIFVHDSSDLLIYGIIIVGSTVGNNFINFIYLRKYVGFSVVSEIELSGIFRHLFPSVKVFVLNIIISLYVQLNPVMLGFMTNDEQVGYYSAGIKITHVAITVITSIGAVLLPRCSTLVSKNDMESFSQIIHKSINTTMAISLPLIVGLLVLAVPITELFCGHEFMPSIPVLYLNAPIIIFMTLSNLMVVQILYPLDKVRISVIGVSAGALINIILNLLFVPKLGATGAALSVFFAEIAVFIMLLILGKAFYPFKLSAFVYPKYFFAALIMGLAVYCVTFISHSYLFQVLLGFIVGLITYALLLIVFKDPLILESIKMISGRICHKTH